ncbi:MAG: hypothetical protein ACRDNG_06395, partial [Gaiellaceae bacterium]
RPDGLLVDRLLEAGHDVVPIHANAFHAARPRWEGAGSKSDVGGRATPSQLVADFLATFAIFGGLVSLVYYPGRLGTAAVFVSILAAGLGGRDRYLVPVSVGVTTSCWFLGMVLAIVLERPIF